MRVLLFLGTSSLVIAAPAFASASKSDATPDAQPSAASAGADHPAPAAPQKKQAFTTGVAKGRDMLDSAISASALDEDEIQKFGARSLSEALRNIPGIRAEADSGEGGASYTIRGLPLSSSGSKFLQFEEDGLPVLEFGDLSPGSDTFLRADLSLSQIQAIRGGSASTFASNSPGGVINLISRTGDVEGGDVMVTSGLDYGEKRFDFDYGAHVSDSLRFNVGGFYRQGEGPRQIGYDAYQGGQIKLNVTKEFAGGYIRVYGKYLDDHTPDYVDTPVGVSGTDAHPHFNALGSFEPGDQMLSRNIRSTTALDGNNQVYNLDMRDDSRHAVEKSVGVEASFEVAGWTINEKFRFAAISGASTTFDPVSIIPAAYLGAAFGGPGATLSYASGPNAGQPINSPSTINGNGLSTFSLIAGARYNSLNNFTNDLRANRVWHLPGGDLTATAGYYHANQTVNYEQYLNWVFTDVAGGGNSALIDITDGLGRLQTQGGVYAFGGNPASPAYRRLYDVDYTVDAPYGSLNYHFGKFSLGASARYDIGHVNGAIYGGEINGDSLVSVDMNQNGVISLAEMRTAIIPLDQPAPVNYDYHYLSYSAGINYRVAEDFALFGRYSKGGRAAGTEILFSPSVSYKDGSLVNQSSAYDPVRQAELGAKFRKGNLELNLTGFWASTQDQGLQVTTDANGAIVQVPLSNKYRAIGAEFEGNYSVGPFAIASGATYTQSKIQADLTDPALDNNTPRHQPKLIFFATPQVHFGAATVGTNIVGTGSSYAQDTNQLKLPGYTVVNAFVQLRPKPGLLLMVNASNLFNTLGITAITQAAIPALGVVDARTINPRTVSASLRLSF